MAVILGQRQRVIAYVDHLGRLEGTIARIPQRFAMTIGAPRASATSSPPSSPGLPTGTFSICRKTAATAASCRATVADLKHQVTCRIIDLSASGAAIGMAESLRPAVDSMVTIGKSQGRVVRHIENGFAVEFTRLQHPDFLEDNVTGE